MGLMADNLNTAKVLMDFFIGMCLIQLNDVMHILTNYFIWLKFYKLFAQCT